MLWEVEEIMGTLIGMAIPLGTTIIGKAADHTYVKCGTGGKAWRCWGRSTGGRNIAQGSASTKRAGAIATQNGTASNQSAGLKCYLVNGVCHQAANRILVQAGVTIRAAHGYWISSALFGTYGKVGFWPCFSPFNKFPKVNGDLSECIDPSDMAAEQAPLAIDDRREQQYLKGVLSLYEKAEPMEKGEKTDAINTEDAIAFQSELFRHMVEFRLGSQFESSLTKNLEEVRNKTEVLIVENETAYKKEGKDVYEFVNTFNKMTIQFQDEMASVLNDEQYQTLFDQERKPEDHVLLSDPEILKEVYDVDIEKLSKWDTRGI